MATVFIFPSKSTMVNTRKGNYHAHSFDVVNEAPVSQSNMHCVRMRGRHFKSTLTQRMYHQPSEKPQVNAFESSHLSVHDEVIVESVAECVETAPSISKTHISEMDSQIVEKMVIFKC